MTMELPGAYRPGTTLIHRIPAGPKLGLLTAYGVLSVVLTGPWTALALLACSVGLAVWVRLSWESLRRLKVLLLMLCVVAAYQTWQRDWAVAVHVIGDLLALIIAALVFTSSTSVDSMLDAITRGLRPLRRLGVRPERVALAFSLVLRTIPQIVLIATETRDAARARGLERNPRALLVPMALRTVGHALATGDALAARGIGDADA